MTGTLVQAALRKSLAQINYVAAVRPAGARGIVAEVYQQVEQDFGMLAPPVALHSPAPETLAAAWLMLRETLVAAGLLDRAAKEAVAAAVSRANECPYCVDVHSSTLDAIGGGHEYPEIIEWAQAIAIRHTAGRRDLPCPIEQAPELVGVVVTFQYLNRMVNVFLPDTPLPPGVPGAARRGALTMLGRFMRSATRSVVEPGRAAGLLPAAALPADLGWAMGNPGVTQAFARAAAAVAAAGDRSVPDSVRALLKRELDNWTGHSRGLGGAWVDDALTGLPAADRPAGRLALLTAFASYQVGNGVIEEFRHTRPDDKSLVELISWTSMAAARRVGSWIQIAHRPGREPAGSIGI